jgi:hypothetical protein
MGHDVVELAGDLATVFGERSAHFGLSGAIELVGAFFLLPGVDPGSAD